MPPNIETVLYSHPDIEEAALIPIPDEEIGNQIKAFVVLRNGQEMTRNAFDAFCAAHLPKYMVPHQMAFCAALPKTSTGKIDKVQLQS